VRIAIATLTAIVVATMIVATVLAKRSAERGAAVEAWSRSSASSHLPAGCDVAARVDIAALQSDPAIARQLASLLSGEGARWAGIETAGAERALRRAGIDPGADLDDAVVCVVAPSLVAPAAMLVVVGGRIRRDALVPALADLGAPTSAPIAGRRVVRRKDGGGEVIVGQADDGAIVLATTEALFDAAPAAGALPEGGPVAVAIGNVALVAMGRGADEIGQLAARELSVAERVTAVVDPIARRAEVRFETSGAAAAIQVETALDELVLPIVAQQLPPLAGIQAATRRIEGGALVLELKDDGGAPAAL
jgi:hypothetical protein